MKTADSSSVQGVGNTILEEHVLQLRRKGTNVGQLLPEEYVWFWDGWMGREERGNGMSVGSSDSGEKGGGMERAGIEEVRGFCEIKNVSNRKSRCKGRV
jgi:hypothetical protein